MRGLSPLKTQCTLGKLLIFPSIVYVNQESSFAYIHHGNQSAIIITKYSISNIWCRASTFHFRGSPRPFPFSGWLSTPRKATGKVQWGCSCLLWHHKALRRLGTTWRIIDCGGLFSTLKDAHTPFLTRPIMPVCVYFKAVNQFRFYLVVFPVYQCACTAWSSSTALHVRGYTLLKSP